MSAATANINSIAQVAIARAVRDVAASTHVYSGTLVCTDAAGNLKPASDTSGLIFDGYAETEGNNASGSAGDKTVEVSLRGGPNSKYLEVDAVSPDKTWINQIVAASDDHTVALLVQVTHEVRVGRVSRVSKTGTAGRVIVDTSDITTTALSGS